MLVISTKVLDNFIMTYLLYVFIYFYLTNKLLSSPNDIFAELWKNNLSPKDTSTNDLKLNQKVEPYEKQLFGEGKQTSSFRILRIKDEPYEETGDYGREYYGAVQVKQEANDGAVQVKHEADDGAVQVKQETVQLKQETDDGAVHVKHNPHLGTVQDQEKYLSDEESNGSPGDSVYEKSNDIEGKSDSLSNEEQQKSKKKIIKKVIPDYEKKTILKKFLEKSERLAKQFGRTPKSKLEEIARELGTCLRTIKHWKFQFGIGVISDYERKQILKTFLEKKECLAKEFGSTPKSKLEKIAKELGVCLRTIINWKLKFGIGIKKSKYQSKRLSDDQREKIIKKFDNLKEKRIGKNKFTKLTEIEDEIARELGVRKQTIHTWKIKFGKNYFKHYSQEEKLKILKKLEKNKNRNNGKAKWSNYDAEYKIAKEIGVSTATIWRWKQEFGISKFHCFTELDRLMFIKKYLKMIKENPHLSREDIAAKLNIPKRTINLWISKVKNKISANNIDSDSPDEDVLPHPQTSIDENAWAWNRCTKSRRHQTSSAEMF